MLNACFFYRFYFMKENGAEIFSRRIFNIRFVLALILRSDTIKCRNPSIAKYIPEIKINGAPSLGWPRSNIKTCTIHSIYMNFFLYITKKVKKLKNENSQDGSRGRSAIGKDRTVKFWAKKYSNQIFTLIRSDITLRKE